MSAPDLDALLAGEHDYSSSAEAVVECAVVAFNYAAEKMGLTGFQGSWAALSTYTKVMGYDCPVIVFKGEDMLYPQYDLPARLATWMEESKPWLAEQAAEKLFTKRKHAAAVVVDHWKRLVSA